MNTVERVRLVDRPGRFFVINRSLGKHLLLLDENEREFSVPSDQEGAEPRRRRRRKVIRVEAAA